MRWTLFVSTLLFSLFTCMSFAQPNSTSPQNPSMLYHPHLHKGNEFNPFIRQPLNNILTGNDKSTTTFDQSGYMDTTPVDDTGTEKDIYHKLQPNWIAPEYKPAPTLPKNFPNP